MSSPRRKLDQYFTPAHATYELLKHIYVQTRQVLECCNGDGGISGPLANYGAILKTNDIDPELRADYHTDASDPRSWLGVDTDWVISNPPFNLAPQIIPLAYEYANTGIAMLLRLSYLEPCESRVKSSRRGLWLQQHPPSKLIVLPRISFTGNGKTDNVTCAWFVWEKANPGKEIVFALKGSS